MAETANYIFLPWVRQGAASSIQVVDRSPNQRGVVSVPVDLHLSNDPTPIKQTVRLYGPGDVTGIDQQQIVRTEPRNLSFDFEPNYFPAIEFDRPDFPWLLTPAKADTNGILRPWLCLVVVKKQDGVTLRTGGNLPLPVLEIKSADDELPDLSESWAWAHVQVAGTSPDKTSLQNALAGDPALTVSRLLCPRQLDPLTNYLACVVPTFELGRKAGLGLPIRRDDQVNEENELKPAWEKGAASATLPVYYHWEFRTGTSGDFEALVGLLKPADLRDIPGIGKREVDVGQAFGKRAVVPSGTTLELEGALRVPKSPAADWPNTTKTPFQAELKKILDEPWLIAQNEQNKDPIVAPPIYGCWHAARHTINIPSLTWLDELNIDPRLRSIAALGTQVIQTQQEQLMASAWEQLGEIDRINQIRRQAQLGRAVNGVYYTKHFKRFSPETLLKVTASAQARLVVQDPTTKARALLSKKISDSAMPDRAVSATLRQLSSPRNAINTRFRTVGVQPLGIVSTLRTALTLPRVQMSELGLVKIDAVANLVPQATTFKLNDIVRFERALTALESTAFKLGNDFTIAPEGQIRILLNFAMGAASEGATATAFKNAAKDLHRYLQKAFAPPPATAVRLAPAMDLAEIGKALLPSLNPENTIKSRVQASLLIASNTKTTEDPLEPIMDAPQFPQPMYEALRDISQDFLFPGLEHVPPNTVTLLQPNPNFVESFLVGLNAEMGHELLWRNYPTDQRGTYFRQFWDTEDDKKEDIAPITDWGDRKLGTNSPNSTGTLVLLIRGELLRRYPNTVIYAAPAIKEGGKLTLSPKSEDERPPLFRGTLKPDVTFIGFTLSEAEALGEPPHKPEGFYFVIQQQPTEPRFGMDEAKFDKPEPPPKPTTWNELSWRHLANTEAELKQLSHASLDSIKKLFPNIDKEKIENAQWARNSAHQAYITMQRPVRIAIHARDIIRK